MKSSLFKNLRLQTYLQLVNAIIPLIITPYIARVLGAEMIGIFSFTTSMASFFTLFAMLGTTNYGTRCIAAETDPKKQKTLFFEVYFLQLVTCFIAIACYLVYFIFCSENRLMVLLQLITLVGYCFDVSWFYFGIEDFKTTVRINLFFRVLSVVLILVLVNGKNDLWVYTVIMLGSAALSQLLLWTKLLIKGQYRNIDFEISKVKRHIVPNLKLFVPLLAMTIYHSTDKAMLGTFSTFEQAGYYYNIDRIINVPFSLFTGIGTVLLPRMTALVLENKEKAKEFFVKTLNAILMLGVAISIGIIAVANEFIPLFLGKGYDDCILLIQWFAPVIIIKCFSNALRVQYLIPFKMESVFIKASCIGAIVNVVLNFVLIPKYGALGAEITTIISELFALMFQMRYSFKWVELKRLLIDLFFYLFAGGLMFGALAGLGLIIHNVLILVVVKVLVGIVVYCVSVWAYWQLSHNDFYESFVKSRLPKLEKLKG